MRFALPSLLAALILAGHTLAPSAAAQRETAFDLLFREYAAGDHDVIQRRLRTLADYDSIRRDLERQRIAWRKDWKPLQAVFLLDIALTSLDRQWFRESRDLIDTARAFVSSRGLPGVDPELDAFEIAWHTTMLSALLMALETGPIEDYLEKIGERVTPAPVVQAPTLIAPHLLLIHAEAHEQLTTPDNMALQRRMSAVPLAITKPDPITRRHADEALDLFEQAATFDGPAAEALVRRGFLLHRLGAHQAALEALDAAKGRGRDRSVRYFNELFRGRVLEALDRRQDAAAAYQAALAVLPDAQSPMVALTVLHVRDGRRDEAWRWTAALRGLPADGYDPWWDYWYGDGRHFPRRRAALRAAVR